MASHTGKVKFFNEQKGFGFIVRDDGAGDVFVHKTGVVGGRNLEKDERVTFDLREDAKGPKAVEVKRAA